MSSSTNPDSPSAAPKTMDTTAVAEKVTSTAANQVAYTPELMAMVFRETSYYDLLQCELTLKPWNQYINDTTELLLKIFRKCKEMDPKVDLNPLFEGPGPNARDLVFQKGSVLEDKNVFETSQAVEKEYLDGDPQKRGFLLRYIFDSNISASEARVLDSQQRPVGWASEAYKKIYCELCSSFHAKICWEAVHPLLQFLKDRPFCIKGDGSRIHIPAWIFYCKWVILCEWGHGDDGDAILSYARHLKEAYDTAQGYNVGKEYFSGYKFDTVVLDRHDRIDHKKYVDGLRVGELLALLIENWNDCLTEVSATERADERVESPFLPSCASYLLTY